MPGLRPNVVAAKRRLAEEHERFEQRHREGCGGGELCRQIAAVRDAVVRELFETALGDLGEDGPEGLREQVALVAHGGYGRNDVAPFSDVDLMILHERGVDARVFPLADRLLRDVFDASMVLGHSVRTVGQAVQLAAADAEICTSLVESRLLVGSSSLFDRFAKRFKRQVQRQARPLLAAIVKARRSERHRYGETVYLLEPNVKRSRGGLRDLQLLRWTGFVRYGTREPEQLCRQGHLTQDDVDTLSRANEFLLQLRNELHFNAGRAIDVLDRSEQLRIAEQLGYPPVAGMLPVEQFMREYFRHTSAVSHIVGRVVESAQVREQVARLATAVFGHRVEGGVRVGPAGLMVSRDNLKKIPGDLTEIMRLVNLANLYDKPIAPGVWESIRRHVARLPSEASGEACRRFLALLDHPGRLSQLLRDLHEAGILGRFLPDFEHARGLLQFNQYHKYTVDEHCLRALEFATDLTGDDGPLGNVYRDISTKRILHLALLLHDLGKGYLRDHREMGQELAAKAAERFHLPKHEAEVVGFLVRHHELMNHLAFRRDTSDERLIVEFAVKVGSPEVLRMLYVMTAADLGAVGPDVWDDWKAEILTDLYRRAMHHLSDEAPAPLANVLARRRTAVAEQLGSQAIERWFRRQLQELPSGYLNTTSPEEIAADLRMLKALPRDRVHSEASYAPETGTVEITVAAAESITPGVFHKLTGALTSRRLQIRSAQINTLADGLVLDRFSVFDPDFTGHSPDDRLEDIRDALVRSLTVDAQRQPSFRRTWQTGGTATPLPVESNAHVRIDNTTSRHYTILDIFAADRPGLLYQVSRTLFELDLSVARAKIGTYADQVVDVFYVTDARREQKILDEKRLEEIRRRLIDVISGG